jgi:phosphatidylserine decarboxylase
MTEPVRITPRLEQRAARALTLELARQSGPKSGILIGFDDEVLDAALETLQPGDSLTVVGGELDLTGRGSWLGDRVTVVASLADAAPADVVMVGTIFTGTADEARTRLEEWSKHVADGGVLAIAVPVGPTAVRGGAAGELERQAAMHGVGSDLVLRNIPPVCVHRLRFTPVDAKRANRLVPRDRPSSVPFSASMNLDSNGVVAAGLLLGAAAVARVIRPRSQAWLLPALLAGPVAAFFRDPQREIPADPSAIVAASDGKVLGVETLTDARFGSGEFLRIAVFLSVLDVHVNRAPVAGKVVEYFVEDGGYAAAMKPEAEHNVAAYTVLETDHGPVVVAQRTGLIARRIVHRSPVGSLLARGERFGLIRFGSRTDVYLPAGKATAAVDKGDRVFGGSSIIAHWL